MSREQFSQIDAKRNTFDEQVVYLPSFDPLGLNLRGTNYSNLFRQNNYAGDCGLKFSPYLLRRFFAFPFFQKVSETYSRQPFQPGYSSADQLPGFSHGLYLPLSRPESVNNNYFLKIYPYPIFLLPQNLFKHFRPSLSDSAGFWLDLNWLPMRIAGKLTNAVFQRGQNLISFFVDPPEIVNLETPKQGSLIFFPFSDGDLVGLNLIYLHRDYFPKIDIYQGHNFPYYAIPGFFCKNFWGTNLTSQDVFNNIALKFYNLLGGKNKRDPQDDNFIMTSLTPNEIDNLFRPVVCFIPREVSLSEILPALTEIAFNVCEIMRTVSHFENN